MFDSDKAVVTGKLINLRIYVLHPLSHYFILSTYFCREELLRSLKGQIHVGNAHRRECLQAATPTGGNAHCSECPLPNQAEGGYLRQWVFPVYRSGIPPAVIGQTATVSSP